MHNRVSRLDRLFQSFSPAEILVMGFALLILLGAILLTLPIAHNDGQAFPFVDALFTATSAVCVTGLIVADTATEFTLFGQVVIITLIQMGGLGIMTVSALIFLMLGKKIGLRERLVMQEQLGAHGMSGVVRLTRNVVLTSLLVEGLGALFLSLRFLTYRPLGEAIYWGIFHAISAFNNAGFDVTFGSLKPLHGDGFVLVPIAFLIFLGGIGFPVLMELWRTRGRWERLSVHARIALTVSLWAVGIGTLLYLLFEWANPETFGPMSPPVKVLNAFFASVTPRTAGFESVATGAFRPVTLLLTVLLMFMGASPGGTGGGVKTTTLTMVALTVRRIAKGEQEVQLFGRRFSQALSEKAFAVTTLATVLVVLWTALLMITERQNPAATMEWILFEVVSAFGTVGLTAGLTPMLTVAGKLLIALMMFIGRLGPLTLAVALAGRTKQKVPLSYPEDRVMIG
ncbi:MAG TPA: TrkH family potassium uptake protein [Symbiobacteriaceae bacterium]|nr:TrkH family potassium uptake protein [Symbiobacteriaceae bacterium]